jgi:hypothetical protein
MTPFVHSEEPHEHSRGARTAPRHARDKRGNPKLEQGVAPLQFFSLTDRGDNEMLIVLTWL